jgi:hypothetical protein
MRRRRCRRWALTRLPCAALLCSDGLFAAAGVKMASTTPKARQSMLAEVSKPVARQHVNIDSGSSERLVAAAENRLLLGGCKGLARESAPPHIAHRALSASIRCAWMRRRTRMRTGRTLADALPHAIYTPRLHAFDRKVHFSNRDKEVAALKQALGSKIAKYFEAQHSNL